MRNLHPLAHKWIFPPDYDRLSSDALNTALSQVELYSSWRRFDPGPGCPIDSRFAAMPVLTKRKIRTYFPQGILPPYQDVSRGLASGKIELVETSGTTNDKITNIWNQEWWDASERASWQLNSFMAGVATGHHREAILVNPRNVGFISDNVDLPMDKRRLSRFLYLNEKTDTVSWSFRHMDRMVKELNDFQPVVFEANPTMLAKLCRYIAASGKAVFQPGIIIFTYEYPTNFAVWQIRSVFHVPMASSYGTTKVGGVFMQCEEGKFHQNSEFCRVDFQPLKPEHGGPLLGRILVTPFNNPWSYLIRFETGDLVCLEKSGECPCGRNSGLILSSINGRKTNLTLTGDGRPVTLFELDNALSVLRGVDEYQLVQTDSNNYELHLVGQRPDKNGLADEASEVLRNLYGNKSMVSIIYETAISPETSGKYLVSKSLFDIELERYLDKECTSGNNLERSQDE